MDYTAYRGSYNVVNVWRARFARFIVDGATFVARSLTLEGSDVAVAKPELCTIYVWLGLESMCGAFLRGQGGRVVKQSPYQ